MPDQTVPVAAPAPAPAPEAAPKPPTPADMAGATFQSKVSLESLKAARRAAATPAPVAAPTPVEAKPPEPAPVEPKPATATIDMDEGQLAQFTSLNRDLRAAKAKAQELETKLAELGKFEKVQAMAKEGKHYEAAREAGIDVDAAIAELLGKEPAGEDKVAQLSKTVEELLADKAKAEADKAEQAKQAQAQAEQAGRDSIVKAVQAAADKYPFLAKSPDLVHAALKDADAAYDKLKAELPKGEDLPAADKNKLLLTALDVHEQKWAKTFGKPKEEPATPGFSADLRGNVAVVKTAPPKKMTWDEVKSRKARPAAAKP